MTDAAPSNAGDRYHFVYVARRMLDMLPPNSKLSLIQMENISISDQDLAESPDDLLGVDLSEYYEGHSFRTASRIELTQVKYSPLHPTETWTLVKLARNKRSNKGSELQGTSVLRKLANMFDVAYKEIGEQCRSKIGINLITNQPLHPLLAAQLTSIQDDLRNQKTLNDTQSGQYLKKLASEGNSLIKSLQKTTNLSWKRLSAYLRCWDLSAFGQAMSMEQETEFAQLLDQYVDMGIHFGNLIDFVQDHAIPKRRTDITKEQVLGILRLHESSFFPAPTIFENIEQLQVTEDVKRLRELILQSEYPVVLAHGVSGTGKSSTLQLLQHYDTDNKAVVIYDCFGNGQGVGLDTRRFPFKNFYVQLINEFALRFNTNLFITTQIDSDEIRQRFGLAIAKAAKTAALEGKQLIVAVDAIDDAAEAALEQPNLQDDCFVPTLWKVRWPENCKLVVTTRTENRHLFKINRVYSEIELFGFSPEETDNFLQANGQITDKEIIQFTHQRTQGNPRVLSKILEAVAHEQPTDLRAFIDEFAETTTFEYYRQQVPKVLGDNQNDWLLLAILREATQFITVEELSNMGNQPQQNIRSLVGRLYFGLRIIEDEIRWHDKDFVSYVRQFSGDYIEDAQKLLAEYCLQHFEVNKYAQQHLSRHLFRAGQHKTLISWWMSDDRLVTKLVKSQPHTEDAADDIQYTLLSAIAVKEFETALKVLALAAEIAQGLDVFSTTVTDFPRVIAEQGYTGRLLGHLRRREDDSKLMTTLFSLARALVEYVEQHEIGGQLFREGWDVAERIKRQYGRDTIWENKTILDIAVYEAYVKGLAKGLESLARWKPADNVAKAYTDLIYIWCQQHDAQNTLDIIQNHTLSDRQKIYSYLGILKNGELASTTVQVLADEVLSAMKNEVIDIFSHNSNYDHDKPQHLPMVLDSLIRHEVKDISIGILRYWNVPAPTSRHHVDPNYAQYVAYRHHLEIESFDPDLFEIPDNEPKDTNITSSANEYKKQERTRETSEIRTMLKLLFPPRLIRLRALSDTATEVILQEINDYIDKWWKQSKPYWYTPFFASHVRSSCSQLIEAVCFLPNYHGTTIQRIIELTERLVGSEGYYFLSDYADILSLHTSYQAEAESLIYQQWDAIKVPDYSASDAVTALLELYPVALRLDSNLARQIFIKARIEAGGWDNRLDGAAYALVATLQHAQPTPNITVEQLNQLVAVFQVIKKVTEGYEVTIHLDWLIRLLTNINPHYSFAALFDFDKSDFMSLQDSLEGIAHSLLDQGILPETVYPLSYIVDSVSQGTPIYQRAALLAQGNSRDNILSANSRYVQIETDRHRRHYYARQLVDWAEQNNLSQYQTVRNIDVLTTQLEVFNEANERSEKDGTNYYRKGQELFAQFEIEIAKSPQLGLQVILEANSEDLRNMRFAKQSKVMRQLAKQLPSRNINDVLQIIERLHERSYEPEAFSLLTIVVESSLPAESVREACIQCLERMLRPGQLDNITRWWHRKHLDALLSSDRLEKQDILQVFLRATSSSLSSLYANELYRLAGALSRALESQQSYSVYEALLKRAVAKLPSDYSYSVTPYPTGDLYNLYIRFLADCLGHPDQRLCWSVLYALVDICINRPNPSIALLIGELDDKNNIRWMTKKVWLLILFHHLVMREPLQLAPFVQNFSDIALDKNFPHAKMRYHAKHIVISLANISPELIESDVLAEVEQVNRPKSTLKKVDYSSKHRDEEKDEGWSFDWDTTRYWFSRIEDCFGGDRPTVAFAARKWILNKLGFSADDAPHQVDWVSKKYDYRFTSNDHGSLPRVESYRNYANLHACHLVAGEFVDSYPAYLESWSNETRWEDYERYHIRGLDPILPLRLIRPLPTTPANYDVFDKSYEDWVQKNDEKEFLIELWQDTQKEELVVAANFGADSDERDWGVAIDSYLVYPESSASLARLINSQEDFITLPHTHYALYDHSLTDIANKLLEWDDDSYFFEGEIDNGIFKLFGLTHYWSQELPQQELDVRQEGHGLTLELFAPPFLLENRIRFDPLMLEWHQEDGGKIAYNEYWSDREGRGRYEKFTSGHKLIVRQDFLQTYLHENDLELLITVQLRRNRPYTERYKKEREYDHGTVRAFIFNANGEVTLQMENRLIEKGQKLIDEFSQEQPTTLQRWMAYHIAELMERIESAETVEERQIASNKCADIVTKLWAVESEQTATKLQQKLWNVIRLPDEELDLEYLSNALKNPPQNEDLTPEAKIKLFQLVEEVEHWVWRILLSSDTVNNQSEKNSLEDFLQREKMPDLIAKLAQVFPEFTDLDITDTEDAQKRVTKAMKKLYVLRHSLVWGSDASEE